MKKKLKTIIPVTITVILALVIWIATLYVVQKKAELPISLPLSQGVEYHPEVPANTEYIMEQWRSFSGYEPSEKINNVDDLISSGQLDNIQEITKEELENIFPIVDQSTLDEYILNHQELITNGYEMLFIDEVDKMNTPTGIKTVLGDDVLAIDAINKIVIAGRDIVSDSGTSKVKIALSYDIDSFNMSLVKNLSYWDLIEKHAKDNKAVLAINASGYNWRDNGAYAALYGALRYEEKTFRKEINAKDVIAFDAAKTMHIGYPVEDSYYAIEYFPTLIKDGEIVYSVDENTKESRSALTAIGQTEDKTMIFVVASGGVYDSGYGVTYSDLLSIMNDYEAYNAAVLSGGSRTVMYWNGRVVNETVDYPESGVRLPNTFYISYYTGNEDNKEDTSVDVTSSTQETSTEQASE